MSDFEGGGGRIPKEYYRTDPGSREHGGGGLSGSAVEYVEIKLTFERTFRGKSPLVNLYFNKSLTDKTTVLYQNENRRGVQTLQ